MTWLERRDDARIERLVDTLGPVLDTWFDPVVRGLERIPEGPALYVGNHNAGMLTADTYVLCAHIFHERGARHFPYSLGHDVVTRAPVLGDLLGAYGGIPAGHEAALEAFEAGHKVLVYPGGDVESLRPTRRRNQIDFAGRQGYVRLAMRAGVPVVPIVAAGAHSTFLGLTEGRRMAKLLRTGEWLRLKVAPVVVSIPWGVTVGVLPPHLPLPTRMFIEVLDPVEVEGEPDDDEVVARWDAEIRTRMQAALDRLVDERRRVGRIAWLPRRSA